MRSLGVLAFLLPLSLACSSSTSGTGTSSSSSGSSTSSTSSTSSGGGSDCPNVAGTWTVSQHCDSSLVGETAVVDQTGCSLSFEAPFDGFSGTITKQGQISLSGPQSCTGGASESGIALSCTPGQGTVVLAR